MRFSLVLATVNRTREVERFLQSIDSQTHHDFDLIVVDQNDDDRLTPLLQHYEKRFSVKHLRSERGLSRARNVGLGHVEGDIVAFPDDDCVYPNNLLSSVAAFFEKNPDYDGLTGRATLLNSSESAWRFDKKSGNVTQSNLFERAVSFTIFLRRETVQKAGDFDINLGVGAGTVWGSGEESDYLLRCLRLGARIYYDTSIEVGHPAIAESCNLSTVRKGYNYGRGMGLVLRRHHCPWQFVIYRLLRPMAGAFLSLARLNPLKSIYYLATFWGRLQGYFDGVTKSTLR